MIFYYHKPQHCQKGAPECCFILIKNAGYGYGYGYPADVQSRKYLKQLGSALFLGIFQNRIQIFQSTSFVMRSVDGRSDWSEAP